jgi:hypothetical protein
MALSLHFMASRLLLRTIRLPVAASRYEKIGDVRG